MEKWLVQAKKADFNRLGKKYGISPVIARVIRNRDVITDEDFDSYLLGNLNSMHNPEKLPDMKKAAGIICDAIDKHKKIRIIGDYDIDGVCSGYIFTDGLLEAGANVDFDVPHRIHDGYGINDRLIKKAKADGVDLIVTCDNGIAAVNQVELAKELGLDIIITDHHEVPFDIQNGEKVYRIPEAMAVVDAKRMDNTYPFQELCGAGVAYKTIEYIYKNYNVIARDKIEELLKKYRVFAAIATVGDIVPLKNENRIIVKDGLANIKKVDNPGLRALIDVNGYNEKTITSYHIGFVLGPCINAVGRLDTAKRAFELFSCKDNETALKMATELKDINDQRKSMTENGVITAINAIEENEELKKDRVIVTYLPGCHESLAGIIAGKLKEKYYKPTLVFTDTEDGLKGSGRSVEGYSMFEELTYANIKFKEKTGEALMTKFGGHKMAAGVSLKKENLESFRKILNQSENLNDEILVKKVWIDVALPFEYISYDMVEQLNLLEPFGAENAKPVFAERCTAIDDLKVYGKNRNVISFKITNNSGQKIKATYFLEEQSFAELMTEKFGEKNKEAIMNGKRVELSFNIIYYPEINEYNNKRYVQITVSSIA